MEDAFERRVRSAGVAGWWTVLAAAALTLVQWLLYLVAMSWRPDFALSLWGPGTTWQRVQDLWFLGLACIKFLVLLLAVPSLWLTLWARELRTHRAA